MLLPKPKSKLLFVGGCHEDDPFELDGEFAEEEVVEVEAEDRGGVTLRPKPRCLCISANCLCCDNKLFRASFSVVTVVVV